MTAHFPDHFPSDGFCGDPVVPVKAARRRRGQRAYFSGVAAEESVAQDYARRGLAIERRRFRAKQGEIDLVIRDGLTLVFVEVKKAATFERAANSLSARQMARICGAAEEYLAAGCSWGEDGPKRVIRNILDNIDRDSILASARKDILTRIKSSRG